MSESTPRPTRLEPQPDEVSAPFWEATRERRLIVQWCEDCDAAVFFPRAVCPSCLGTNLVWRPSSGTGVLYAVTVEHRLPNPIAGQDGPYAIGLVDVAEGWRMLTNVVGCDPADLRTGMGVSVAWEPLSDGRHLPLFSPVEAPDA